MRTRTGARIAMATVDGYKLSDDADFDHFRKTALAEGEEGWTERHSQEQFGLVVWSKLDKSVSPIEMVRMSFVYEGVTPELLYDVLHDPDYRSLWDPNMIEGKVIQLLNHCNEVGYYAAKTPSPLSNRDFVTHRRWRARADEGEYIIFNNSVEHKDMPEKKGFVRANSILAGYLVRRHEKGARMDYLAQSDLKGWIPSWAINFVASKFVPGFADRLFEACKKYPEWKAANNPSHKPWLATA